MKGSAYLQLAPGEQTWVKDRGDGTPGYVPTLRVRPTVLSTIRPSPPSPTPPARPDGEK